MSIKFVDGYVACIENNDKSRFCNGSLYLYSEPHPTEEQANDWVWAHNSLTEGGVNCIRIECNKVPEGRLVKPLARPEQAIKLKGETGC